jgi:predicted RNase H-like HicB family nuclease
MALRAKSHVDRLVFESYQLHMNFGVLFEKVTEKDFPSGYFYAHVPSLGLTTHGLGIEGARAAAADLVKLWLAEKKANHEQLPTTSEILFSTLDIPEDALQSA